MILQAKHRCVVVVAVVMLSGGGDTPPKITKLFNKRVKSHDVNAAENASRFAYGPRGGGGRA